MGRSCSGNWMTFILFEIIKGSFFKFFRLIDGIFRVSTRLLDVIPIIIQRLPRIFLILLSNLLYFPINFRSINSHLWFVISRCCSSPSLYIFNAAGRSIWSGPFNSPVIMTVSHVYSAVVVDVLRAGVVVVKFTTRRRRKCIFCCIVCGLFMTIIVFIGPS